MLKLEKN